MKAVLGDIDLSTQSRANITQAINCGAGRYQAKKRRYGASYPPWRQQMPGTSGKVSLHRRRKVGEDESEGARRGMKVVMGIVHTQCVRKMKQKS